MVRSCARRVTRARAMAADGAEEGGHVKVLFEVEPDADDYPPPNRRKETLWATRAGNGEYELDNIPFFVRLMSAGDVVAATPIPGSDAVRFHHAVRYGGHSTIRVHLKIVEDVSALRQELRAVGADTELGPVPRLVAVDVPPEVRLSAVREILDRGERHGLWEYEEASLQHSDD